VRSRSSAHLIVVLALVGALLTGAAFLQRLREDRYQAVAEAEDSLDVTSGNTLKHLTAGYNAVASDLYWIRAIQYYGGIKLAQPSSASSGGLAAAPDYRLLYPLLDLTTTLDPRFNIAYRFGAIFLAEPRPGGAGRPDLAIALLEKGLRERPDKWEYMQDIGFVYYWWRQDYRSAADWFARAGERPGAPWWLRSLAATTLAEGGDRQSSRVMWEALRESAEIDWLKRDAERRLLQLQAMDTIDALQARIDAFATSTGQTPAGWLSLVPPRARVFPGVPVDPERTPYELDAAGRVHLSAKSPLFPLPDEPKRMVAPHS
jgi:tetratricopeptide (TPR) repeat protein